MPNATITVAGILPPGPGKKQGHVHDTEGNKWNVWHDKIQNFRMGVTYDITYEQSEFNGAHFNVIKTANPSNGAPQPRQQQAAPPNDGWPGPAPRAPTPMAQQPSVKDEMIFVCGVINNAMSNPNVDPFAVGAVEFVAMVNKARQVWRNTLGKSQAVGDMNDEIPFS